MTDMRHGSGAVSPGPGSERTEVWPQSAACGEMNSAQDDYIKSVARTS